MDLSSKQLGLKLQNDIISNKIINKFTLTQHQLLLEQELI